MTRKHLLKKEKQSLFQKKDEGRMQEFSKCKKHSKKKKKKKGTFGELLQKYM